MTVMKDSKNGYQTSGSPLRGNRDQGLAIAHNVECMLSF